MDECKEDGPTIHIHIHVSSSSAAIIETELRNAIEGFRQKLPLVALRAFQEYNRARPGTTRI
jgi:hypothetical protein